MTERSGHPAPAEAHRAFLLTLAGASLSLFAGMVLLASPAPHPMDANMAVMGWVNCAAGLALGWAAARFRARRRRAAAVLGGVSGATIIADALAVFSGVMGYATLINIALLAFAVLFAFRPATRRWLDSDDYE